VFGLEAFKCTGIDHATVEDLSDANAGLQVECVQTLGNVNAPSMHSCSILVFP
jgi:checkpoint serine/threonine-protein kinase